jgi:hypothetical protein
VRERWTAAGAVAVGDGDSLRSSGLSVATAADTMAASSPESAPE